MSGSVILLRRPLLWSWTLVGVPTAFVLVFSYAILAGSEELYPPYASVTLLPAIFVASGLAAGHYAIRPATRRIGRIAFYVMYGLAMYWICSVLAGVLMLAHHEFLAQPVRALSETSAAAYKRFDPSSLVQVQAASGMPDGLKQRIAEWMDHPRTGPEGHSCRLLLGGASETSAVFAYESLGFVPSTHAAAYVRSKDGWVIAHNWDGVGYPTTIEELRAAITKFAAPTN